MEEKKELSRYQIAALKRMHKNISPLNNKIARLNKRIQEFTQEKSQLITEAQNLINMANHMAGDTDYRQYIGILEDTEETIDEIIEEVHLSPEEEHVVEHGVVEESTWKVME